MQTAQYLHFQCSKEQLQIILYAPESDADKDSKIWSTLAGIFLGYEIWKLNQNRRELMMAYDILCDLLAKDNRKESAVINTGNIISLASHVNALREELSIASWRPTTNEPEDCDIFKWVAFCEMLIIWDEHKKMQKTMPIGSL